MKNTHKKQYKITSILLFVLLICFGQNTYSTQYTNNMDYVLGDVKQAFITNRISTQQQADNLLKGFRSMGVNGIRIPIFAEGLEPNKAMLDYFYREAIAQGFLIFANPAQGSGGQRIANGVLATAGGSVRGDAGKSNALIQRIRNYVNEYPDITWVNPFNEDGRPDTVWSTQQMNTIYSSLANTINDVELIGPGVWGIPASILVLRNTDVGDYISIATTHNLGFHHGRWSEFIGLARDRNLPVWDSEVNHNDRFGTGTRLEAALENNVDGLVLYNSWQAINLNNGTIDNSARTWMSLFLKPACLTPPEIRPFYNINNTSWRSGTSVTLDSTSTVKFGPQPFGSSWTWTGPNNFTSNRREIEVSQSGNYIATYTAPNGCVNTEIFNIQDRVVNLRKSNATGFSIDGSGSSSNGQNVYLWNFNSSNANQQWEEIDRGNGYYSYQKKGTNFSLDGGNGGSRGQNVFLWVTQSNNQNQQWRKVNTGNGSFRLEKRNAPGFSIDGGSGGARRQNVYLWNSSNNNRNQQWIFE